MGKRPSKFYFKNEKKVMESLGLKPTKGSGSGWIEKEDGQNDHIIAQLKSTDASSISIKQLDIEKLEYNANISRKIPVFIIEFLNNNELYFLAKPMDIPFIAEYIKCGEIANLPNDVLLEVETESEVNKVKKNTIKSSSKSRNNFWKDKEVEREKWQKKK